MSTPNPATGLEPAPFAGFQPTLPLVSVIILCSDASVAVEGALRSVLAQTYSRWQCVVVDHSPDHGQLDLLTQACKALDPQRFTAITAEATPIRAIYDALPHTNGDFIAILQATDRYAPTFLHEAVKAHLNEVSFCPMVSTEQILFGPEGILTGVSSSQTLDALRNGDDRITLPTSVPRRLTYTVQSKKGWHWTDLSALLIRRTVFPFLAPPPDLPDDTPPAAYLAQGAHLLGGSLFLNLPLVYRAVETSGAVLSLEQPANRAGVSAGYKAAKSAIVVNGGTAFLPKPRTPVPPPVEQVTAAEPALALPETPDRAHDDPGNAVKAAPSAPPAPKTPPAETARVEDAQPTKSAFTLFGRAWRNRAD